MLMVTGGLELLVAAAVVVVAAAISRRESIKADDDAMATKQKQVYQPTQHLIGEEVVTQETVYTIADRMIEEADGIWASPASDWKVISTTHDVMNEGASVSGVFANCGVALTRASAIVDAPADKLFELLASPAGYQLIDPFTDPKDHEKPPIESYDTSKWRSKPETPTGTSTDKPRRLEVANAIAKIPLMATREFLVLNVLDYNTRYFLSKSIQHASTPGTSAYGPEGYVKPSNGTVRALNTFGVQIEPSPEHPDTQCVVRLINFADLGGKFPVAITNFANKNFLVDVVGRMRKAMATSK